MPGTSYKYWYPDEATTQYLYETYPDVSFGIDLSEVQDVEACSAEYTNTRATYHARYLVVPGHKIQTL